MKKISLLSLLILITGLSFANNITVSSATISGQNTTAHTEIINFNVGWENSWRTSTNESNYDGAWIFVKFRKMGTTDWRHCTINVTGAVAGAGGMFTIPADGKGAFIHKAADGVSASVNYTGNQLVWNYGVDGVLDNETVEIRVFGLEMVYIPTGSFLLGSGGTETNGFRSGGTANPYLVASAGAITTGTAAGELDFNGQGSGATIPATFPTGYNAFWIMKYECSQQQYVDFLNHLDAARAAINFTQGAGVFTGTHPNYVAAAPERALATVGYKRTAAIADWSGLRPYTELEFEKASRGFNTPAVPNEYVWGNTTLVVLTNVTNQGLPNETVGSPLTANASMVNGYAIVRTGLFARATGSDRTLSGGTYYGVMNMSDNVTEIVVNSGSVNGRNITSSVHGDGYLAANGNTDIAVWTNFNDAFGFRGSNTSGPATLGRTSDRTNSNVFTATYGSDIDLSTSGVRLARTAP